MAQALVIGGGGREHALAWKLAQSPRVERVFAAPGNAGTALAQGIENVPLAADDIDGLLDFAHRQNIDLSVVGPEAPLVAGIGDRFAERGLACFAPSAAAARLEGSKIFTKEFLHRHGIPTAQGRSFSTGEEAEAEAFIRRCELPLVLKADGLAAGKGVRIVADHTRALAALHGMLSGRDFGEAGRRVLIEEFLQGEEASFIVLADGEYALPLASSQDHKARDAGDRGPNTGGMGAYSPAPVVDAALERRIMQTIIEPTIAGMRTENRPFTGFLYAGLMIDAAGNPRVLEYNCRLGDPEAQVLLLRLRSDLYSLLQAALTGELQHCKLEWDPRCALGVVLAAAGYPDAYPRGERIGLPQQTPSGSIIFHAGTRLENGVPVSDGGRVLCACALGDTVREAQGTAYRLCTQVHWEHAYFRTDIGHRAIAREEDRP